MEIVRRSDERESLADIATMITKGAFKIGTSLSVVTAKYILGTDVKVASRIYIGDNVDWKFICLTRLVFLGVMYNYRNVIHNPNSVNEKGRRVTTGLIPKVRRWIDDWIQDKKEQAESAQVLGEVGANLQMLTTSLMSVTNDVLFQLIGSAIQVVRTVARTGWKLVNVVTGLAPGATQFNLTSMYVALVEGFFTNNVIVQQFGPSAACGLTAFASLGAVATIVENYFVGITAASIEYLAYRGTPRITAETMDMLLDVSQSDTVFSTDFPFTVSTAEVESQLPKKWSIIAFIYFSSSSLSNAIQDAKSILEFRMRRRPSLRGRSSSRSTDEMTGHLRTLTLEDESGGESKTDTIATLSAHNVSKRIRRSDIDDSLQVGNEVEVIAGKYRGKYGTIQKVTKERYTIDFDGAKRSLNKTSVKRADYRHASDHTYSGKKENMVRRIVLKF